jgi:hypothetical protein
MSKRPTPETDAAWDAVSHAPSGMYYSTIPYSDYAHAMADLAKKLERERDEARDALSGRTVSCSQCDQVATERDEARDLARELRGHLQNLVDHGVCNCCHDDEADEDWLSAKSALTKAKEVLP